MKVRSVGRNQTEIEKENGTIVLYSYSTTVAVFVPGLGGLVTEEYYSRTTSKHINAAISRWGCSKSVVYQCTIDSYAA